MKKNVTVMIVMLLIFYFSVSLAFAEETKLTSSQARWSLSKKVLGLGAGYFAGFVGHELVHQFVAGIENVDMKWEIRNDNPYWYVKTTDKSKLRNIALGGFAEQILSSEIILGYDKIPKDNSFVIGYMCFNILNSILYTLANETSLFSKKGFEDLQTLEECGIKKEYVEAVIVSHALLSAWRLYKKPEFLPFIKATRQEIVVGLSWQW